MPNALNRLRGEQWDNCQRCGLQFPMSELAMQKGLLVCTSCTDNLTIERREQRVMEVLGIQPEQEGMDHRWEDRAFYDPYEEQI